MKANFFSLISQDGNIGEGFRKLFVVKDETDTWLDGTPYPLPEDFEPKPEEPIEGGDK